MSQAGGATCGSESAPHSTAMPPQAAMESVAAPAPSAGTLVSPRAAPAVATVMVPATIVMVVMTVMPPMAVMIVMAIAIVRLLDRRGAVCERGLCHLDRERCSGCAGWREQRGCHAEPHPTQELTRHAFPPCSFLRAIQLSSCMQDFERTVRRTFIGSSRARHRTALDRTRQLVFRGRRSAPIYRRYIPPCAPGTA